MNSPATKWQENRWLPAFEAAIIAAIFYADARHHLPFSKVPFLFILGWISLRLRGQGWKDVGLEGTSAWARLVLLGLTVGIGMEALELFVTQPALTSLFGQGPDLHQFNRLIGNTKILFIGLALAWVLAAFGEEVVYRGYLMNRVAGIFQGSPQGWIISLVIVTIVFGCAHAPQGVTGVAENIIDGAILAVLYLATGRNLLAPIIAHGVQDTVDVLLIYSGHYPGM